MTASRLRRAGTIETRRRAPGPRLDPEAAEQSTAATVWLYHPTVHALPALQGLTPRFARVLTTEARRAHVDWALVLGVLRARGRLSSTPADRHGVRSLARRLAALRASTHPSQALLRLSRSERFVEDALTYAAYSRALGIRALVRGLGAATDLLASRVFADPRISIYAGGRSDVASHAVDPRIMVLLRYLAEEFGSVTVSSLISGHRTYARPGVVSAHVYGLAVDIAALGGVPIAGHQGPGSVTERAVEDILRLPPEMEPQQIISLLDLGGPSFALADHDDHIHVGYSFHIPATEQGSAPVGSQGSSTESANTSADALPSLDSLGGSTDASASKQAFIAEADATVLARRPDTNFGATSSPLSVDGSPAQNSDPSVARSYVRFDVKGLDQPVAKAVLRLYALDAAKAGIQVHAVSDNSWDEATITYDNAPSESAGPVASSPAPEANQWVDVDVSTLVTGEGDVSFVVDTTSAEPEDLASKESDPDHAPRLVLETAAAATPPLNTSLPTISGAAEERAILSASPGFWLGTTPITYGYQWQRCDSSGAGCESVDGATAQTYTLGTSDVGATLRVRVTAVNVAGEAPATSAPSPVVDRAPSAPLSETPPSITGATIVGSVLDASAGAWSGTTPISYTYQWRRCDTAGANCSPISGASAATYSLASADVGSTIRVRVTASNSIGSATAVSAQTPVIQSAVTPPTGGVSESGAGETGSVVWSADLETGDMSQWPAATLNWDSGACLYHGASSDYAQSGTLRDEARDRHAFGHGRAAGRRVFPRARAGTRTSTAPPTSCRRPSTRRTTCGTSSSSSRCAAAAPTPTRCGRSASSVTRSASS